MNAQRKTGFWMILVVSVIILSGVGLGLFLLDEFFEEGIVAYNFTHAILSPRHDLLLGRGDESTGEITAWLFGVSMIPVGLDLFFRLLVRLNFLGQTSNGFLLRVNAFQRKYLMPFHTYLSILALGLGILHLTRSSCVLNPLPEIGLILCGVFVITGLLIKWKVFKKSFGKALYKLHTSLIASGILVAILVVGHSVLGLD
jgi:hypothetical protein